MKNTMAVAVLMCLLGAGLASGGGGIYSSVPESNISESKALPELNEGSGLGDYLGYAALNNPGLEAAFNRWRAEAERVGQVGSLSDPRVSYKYFVEEVETRVGPQRQGFEVSQSFPWFGKLSSRADVASKGASAAQRRYEAAKLKVFFEVKDAYYEYYYLAKSVAITKENVSLIKHLEGVARGRYRSAAGTHPDVIRAQVEWGKLDNRYQTLLDLREPIVARLNAAMNRPIDAEISWPEKIEFEDVQIADEDVIVMLMEQNPELEAMQHEIAMNKEKIELAKKDYYPDITLGVGVIDTDRISTGNPRDNGKDPVVAMVSINLPIWRKKYDAGVREARAGHNAASSDFRQRGNSLKRQLKVVLYRLKDARRKIDLYRNALVPKATESLKVTESEFRSGKGGFTDLVDAQRILLEFSLAYERSLTDHAKSVAELEMLVGRKMSSAN